MRNRRGLLISTSVLVVGSIFFAWRPEPAAAQDGFEIYDLYMHCGSPQLPAAMFGHRVTTGGTEGRPVMGTYTMCVGNCPQGDVTLDAALAGLPADVSAALKAKMEKHPAAGAGWFITCLGYRKKIECPEIFLSPKGRSPDKGNCCDKMPEKGGLFVMGKTGHFGKSYTEPSTSSQVTGTFPNGTRVVYNQTTRINGHTWYYVHPPGRPAGWMPGSELMCLRPGTPIPIPEYFDGPAFRRPDGSTERPTAATVAGARG